MDGGWWVAMDGGWWMVGGFVFSFTLGSGSSFSEFTLGTGAGSIGVLDSGCWSIFSNLSILLSLLSPILILLVLLLVTSFVLSDKFCNDDSSFS